ncbi:uncharacterized protein LOC141915202 [Tubulanus polymorphus]|uniref:uncharacterized protein LOC141915202 n=1 Tax=Tubulanus polymorphus TaxID=672921 RepID=UPI003DA2A411
MDERHWWITSKIQESFHVGGFDNPTLLEDFMCRDDTLQIINQFLGAHGPRRLFFYTDKPDSNTPFSRQLHVTGNLTNLKDVNLEEVSVLFFIRHDVERDVDPVHMEKDVYCGELKAQTMESLHSLLSEACIPLLKCKKDWGMCTAEQQTHFITNMEKCIHALSDSAAGTTSLHSTKQMMLRQPENVVSNEYKQQRMAALDQGIIAEYEELVTDWITTIENVIIDNGEERLQDLLSGPLIEFDRWRRRQRMLVSITEQLKGKECKAVIGTLIAAKSKLLKKWKMIDANITDSLNDAKDKVKFLDSIKRHLDQFYYEATPSTIINTALPNLMNSLKQMDSVSRFYARQGYLGFLLNKITNQIVLICKAHIKELCLDDDYDCLWEVIDQESQQNDTSNNFDARMKQLKTQVDSKLRSKKQRDLKSSQTVLDKSLMDRLKVCLSVHTTYKEAIRNMRDGIGLHSLSHFGSITSLSPNSTAQLVINQKSTRLTPGQSPSKKNSSSVCDYGIAMTDEEGIVGHFDEFCSRVRQVTEVINTLCQYQRVIQQISGIPRPRKEDIVVEESLSKKNVSHKFETHSVEDLPPPKPNEDGKPHPVIPSVSEHGNLITITEDEELGNEQQENTAGEVKIVVSQEKDVPQPQEKEEAHNSIELPPEFADEAHEAEKSPHDNYIYEMLYGSQGLTQDEVDILERYYHMEDTDDGPSVISIVRDHINDMKQSMLEAVNTKVMLDVESKEKGIFNEAYASFQNIVKELESFIEAYIHAVLARKMKTQESLQLLTKFSPILHRHGVKHVIAEKYVDIFNMYEDDLIEVQKAYEKHKENPPMPRNAPPVAGAIFWSRQLLHQIEDPMRIFKETKAVTCLQDYGRIVRIYNKLATALVTFESLWFGQLRAHIEQAKIGLKATLLIHHPQTKEIVANTDEGVVELIQEAKWLMRLGIQIPESAMVVLQQELRFKKYKDNIEHCLKEFRDVREAIPAPFKGLFVNSIESVKQQLQPGLSTLAWNSMNIDAFLHQVHTATAKLKYQVERVNEIISTKIVNTITKISEMIFFDIDLAFSKIWPTEEFTVDMLHSIKLKAQDLYDSILIIENGMREAANMLSQRKKLTFKAVATILQAMRTESDGLHSNRFQMSMNDLRDNTSSVTKSESKSRDMKLLTASRSGYGMSSVSNPEDYIVSELLDYYCDDIYEAILTATCRSLVTLAESCGCDSDLVRSVSLMSNSAVSLSGAPTPRPLSRGMSAKSDKRPVSVMSMLSNMTWTTERTAEITYLRFEVTVNYAIPNITLNPAMDAIQSTIDNIASAIRDVVKGVKWNNGNDIGETFSQHVNDDKVIQDMFHQLSSVIADLELILNKHIMHFQMYDFLWKDDIQGNFTEFIQHEPGPYFLRREVERLQRVESNIDDIPSNLPAGPVCLKTDLIKDALHGFAVAWKCKYAAVLHEEAKKKLDAALLYRMNVCSRLELSVLNLDQLNSTLHLLEEIQDMENKIDAIYLPIETMYSHLREFELRLPRHEVENVDSLRDKWQELLELADNLRHVLLKERRVAFEQELDKQVKTFVVEVIQFRNAFDAQGPVVPGIPPAEAVARLHNFQQKFSAYDTKRRTLDSVSKLFGIPCKPFPELDKTGEELDLLGQLYGLFQKFIRFDNNFRDTLWSDVDLRNATEEVEGYWDECLALPSKLKDWDAYQDMKNAIQHYLDVIPLLHKLSSKREQRYDIEEIRNRHWLQVMQVTGSSFPLEANMFKNCHLLDIGLIKHRAEIEEICRCAGKELELEVKLRVTEEEWTEQVLTFEPYKRRGPIYLEKLSTERLLEQLEDAQALLANMLTSRHIGPLREEAASWAEKLKEVGEVLEQWLEVQDLWQYLEAVFSNPTASKELPQEAKRFSRIDKGWTKMMKRAYDTRNVLQCCYGGEVPKGVVLKHFHEELEICFKSLIGYLDSKRRAFPRFFFVSDPILLAILSRPNELDSIKPYLKSIFTAVRDLKLEAVMGSSITLDQNPSVHEDTTRPTSVVTDFASQPIIAPTAQTKLDKRLVHVQQIPAAIQHHISLLPSEDIVQERTTWEASAVISCEGEILELCEKVSLADGVETWLTHLKDIIHKSLSVLFNEVMQDVNKGVSMEELVLKYPTQICRFGMLFYWTKECEVGVQEIKYDRKALHNLGKKFSTNMGKLNSVLSRGYAKTAEEPFTAVHRLRLENLITYSIYLRDVLDSMANRKIREPTDFDWRRNMRCYLQDTDESGELKPCLYMLDTKYDYGCEFYGAEPVVSLTTTTERCFISMAQYMQNHTGVTLAGGTGSGKTETVSGFAQLLGHHLSIFQCSEHSDPGALGKILTGLAMDGCWGCFDELHSMNRECLSVLLDYVSSIYGSLRAAKETCTLRDGQEILINPSTTLFLTINQSTSAKFKLPMEIKSLFRTVNLLKPDYNMILKLKCSGLGFRAPNILSNRLKIVMELSKDQLPVADHHNLSVSSLVNVLRFASHRRKLIREEKSFDKADATRSSSNQSVYAQHSSSNGHGSPRSKRKKKVSQGRTPADRYSRKTGTPNPLTPAAKMEHSIVGQALLEIIGPRLSGDICSVFTQIVKDVFQGLPDPPGSHRAISAHTRIQEIELTLHSTAKENGLIPTKDWVDKCIQLYNVSLVHGGIIVAGPPGSGKSGMIQSLVTALCADNPRGLSRHSASSMKGSAEMNHRLQKINPLVVDDDSLMFGYLHNMDWIDGIFTSAWKKASRNQCTTWLSLDGPLNAGWADNFSTVLDSGKTLHLRNGDRLFLSNNIKLLFETDDLTKASPATVSRAGIVFVGKTVVGWRPIAQAWMQTRSQQEVNVLQRAFDNTVDAISHYVLHEAKPNIRLTEVGMFKSCLNLLSAMLADNVQIGGELHIERLYLFCLIWSFGGLLEDAERKTFSDLLKTLSSALPDDDRDICVFDYYVDESGEWDPWQSRVPEAVYSDNQDELGEIVIDTVDTIRTRVLMDFAVASGQNVLLVGPPGSGKTVIVNDFINGQDSQTRVSKKLVYSGASTAKQLHQFIESNIYHRQGFVYGAKDNKRLQLFIDDLNLPVPDQYGVQKCNELLRQLLDDKVLCTQQKPFEWRSVEDLVILAAMSFSETPSVVNRLLSSRLMRHFVVLRTRMPKDEPLKNIVSGILEANMLQNEQPGLDIDLQNAISGASCKLLTDVQSVLRMTNMPGRQHYLFTLREVTKCFQCLKRMPDESRADEIMVLSLWKHEMERIIGDRICRTSDVSWFKNKVTEIVEEFWPNLEEGSLHENFVTFPIDMRVYQRPMTSVTGQKQVKVALQPIEKYADLFTCLQAQKTRYNEELGNVQLEISLSELVIVHLVRLHRILSLHHGGNALLISAIGFRLATLCKLALHVADIPILPIDSSKPNTFFDGLRSAVRMSGSEGKVLSLLFTARDLQDDSYLDAINSILVAGEYLHLFSNDEMDGLLQALYPALKRENPALLADPMKFFVSRVKSNLHIIICLPPRHHLVYSAASEYPGLLSGCQVDWVCDWPQEALLKEASFFTAQKQFAFVDSEIGESVINCMANIHNFILTESKQIPWAGDASEEIMMTNIRVQDKRKDLIKSTSIKVPNLPYSKTMVLENIKQKHRLASGLGKNEVFVGPLTYRRFMNTFYHIYNKKSIERTETVEKLKKVLAALAQSRTDAKTMRQAIKHIIGKYDEAKSNTAQILRELTTKVTILEKLKAEVGESNALSAFLQLNEMSSDDEEEDDLLKQDDYDEYDKEFDRLREENMRNRHVKAKEELMASIKQVEHCRHELEGARKQVNLWRGKVDRGCIERLKAFGSPPLLVGQVMEMVMTLIGKRVPNSHRPDTKDSSASINYPRDESSSRLSGSEASAKLKSVKMRNLNERVDRAQWKAITQAMNDTTKFVDMLHNVQWEDGLKTDVSKSVESFLAKGRDGQLGITGEGTLLENAPDNRPFPPTRRTPSPDNTRGITLAAARFASEDAATLVQYTIAIVEYTKYCQPLKAALEKQHELEREIEENERKQQEKEAKQHKKDEEFEAKLQDTQDQDDAAREERMDDYTQDDLEKIQKLVDELQAKYDESVVEKHSYDMQLLAMKERLKATTDMIENLKTQEELWQKFVEEYETDETLLANSITAAAFLVYCGSMATDTRKRLGEFFMYACEHHGIKLNPKQLFRNTQLIDFLYTPIEIKKLDLLELPKTPLMLENASLVMQEQSINAWPLICDTTSRIIDWMKFYLKSSNLVVVRYHDLRSQLETSLSDGQPLLITDCNCDELSVDQRFRVVLNKKEAFLNGSQPFKIMVGDHEVECQPSFRLFIHTSTEPHLIPHILCAYVNVIRFNLSRSCIEEELLDRFMKKEKTRLKEEETILNEEYLGHMEVLKKIDDEMVTCLGSDIRLMNDLSTTKKLADLKKHYDESIESKSRTVSAISTILKAREGFRLISKRAAVLFDTSQYMCEINPLYQTSFNQFLSVYDTAINHSDRTSMKAVIERLTWTSYVTTARSLLEQDRIIYTLLLATEVEDSLGRVGIGEREFLVSPTFGAAVMAGQSAQPTDPKIANAKKAFDWMLDDQFANLQLLAIHFPWFQDMFDRMPRDGRETQWRNLCENDFPELVPLPDKMDDTFAPLQRFLILRAVRNDRLMQATTIFINSVLGKKYTADIGVDFGMLIRQSTPNIPIALITMTETNTGELFKEFAGKQGNGFEIIPINDGSSVKERHVKKVISRAMENGEWIFLQDAHNSPHLLNGLQSILNENDQVNQQFRCWVSLQGSIPLPTQLLQSSVKLVIDPPKIMKDNLVRFFSNADTELLKISNRPEWTPLLHNLCYLHGAIKLRSRFGRGGWNVPDDFKHINDTQLHEAIKVAYSEFKDSITAVSADGSLTARNPSWAGMRFMLAEMLYGNSISDVYDQLSLGAMVDYWISPTAVKKEFELAKLKYKHPSVFFSSYATIGTITRALESIPIHLLEAPEACNLHPSSETILAVDQYVFTRLNRLLDCMPSSDTLSHQLFPRPPTPFDGTPATTLSINSTNPYVSNTGVFASASHAVIKMKKDVELWEICHNLIPKVPRIYSSDYLTERIKKIGGLTPFNIYIQREINMMMTLLTDIKTSLQAIKAAVEVTVFGDQLSPKLVETADALYHNQIPQSWLKLAGPSAPPKSFSLINWLNDLTNRTQHFEKILALGREKMPAYWLGAFFNPRGLLALLKQDTYKHYNHFDRSGNMEPCVFQTELTARDKDHLRDPPPEGMFIYGIYIWGCSWDKTSGELQDAPSRHTCTTLPVIHVTCWPTSEKPGSQDILRVSETYTCPVFPTRNNTNDVIMEVDLRHDGIPATRWSLRGLSATCRPY